MSNKLLSRLSTRFFTLVPLSLFLPSSEHFLPQGSRIWLVGPKLCTSRFSHQRSCCCCCTVFWTRNLLVCSPQSPFLYCNPWSSRYKLRHLSNGSALARSVSPESWPRPRRMSSQVPASIDLWGLADSDRDVFALRAGFCCAKTCARSFRRSPSSRATSCCTAAAGLIIGSTTLPSQ